MTDNRWQIGIAGNYATPDDELVRLVILDTQQRLGCSASEAAKWLIRAANAHLQEAPSMHDVTANAPTAQADSSEVISTLRAGFAMLADKLDNIKAIPVSMPPKSEYGTQTVTVVNGNTMEETSVGIERTPIDSDGEFAAMVKKAMRPGMRMEEQ